MRVLRKKQTQFEIYENNTDNALIPESVSIKNYHMSVIKWKYSSEKIELQ